MSGLKWVSFATLLVASLVYAPCSAQTWVQVKGGAFAISPEVLSEMKATLRERVFKEAEPSGEWGKYVLQFRAVRVSGHPAIEIHGSCRISAADKLDLEAEFYEVADEGHCYFQVIYDPNSKRYSNVVFNGYA